MGIAKKLQELAEKWNLTPFDEEEPYTLTKEEEEKAIEFEITSLKKHKAWKMRQIGLNEGTILQKLASISFDELINREEILRRANSNKNYAAFQKQMIKIDREKRLQERDELLKKCDAKYFYQLMRKNYLLLNKNKPFEQDEDNQELIKTVCFFLSRDERFEDKNKGLLIRGVSGLGKTFLFELVKNNELNPVKIVSMIEISEAIKNEGEYHLTMDNERIIYLDDVGTEEATVNHYGTKINWFKDFIEKEYQYKNCFKNIVISTNLNFQQIEENYGFRVRSRMKEMFNVIDVKGKDRRK